MRRSGSGFTLIESLVALIALSVVLLAAFRGAESMSQLQQEQAAQAMALLCANNALSEAQLFFRSVGVAGEKPCVQGDFAFFVRLQVRPTPNINLLAVTATVQKENRVHATLTTLFPR